ncbi:hypothetical protein C5Y96_14095 [Blastopirellula marina]|uniref:CorA-like Mg2+ transporter protein n=1 Tax=Blastopirellula marina TaxID=124 RepID=A0A2S8FEM5_9BACT|nr:MULTISPECIES: hypothetical protein [Pirellulaceae]PQO30597.1 hypothetical protein C5Y96_14095 [Blastopirellula marina]RCS50734.1 hypothetical protein DTL36_14105 [Bremerella cremea]
MSTASPLPMSWEVPQIFHQRLGDGPGRQRVMQADGHLLIVTHRPPRHGERVRGGRYFWRNPAGTLQSSDLGQGPSSMIKHLEEYNAAIAKLEKAENDAQSSEEYFRVISELGPLLRATRNLHSTLQSARELSGNDRTMINFRDRSYDLERSAELLYNEAKNELDFLIAQRTEQQAASSHRMAVSAHRLNILAAFFFPMVTLATIFGSSLQHGWETANAPVPFFTMLIVGFVLGLLLNWFINVPVSPKPRTRHGADARIPRTP